MSFKANWRTSVQGALVAAMGLSVLPGCSGGSSSNSIPTLEPKLSVIQKNVFQRSCVFSSCHGADTPQKGLDLSGSTYPMLVNKPSSEVPARVLVAPSDPGASYLYEKLSSDHPTFGNRMPDTSSKLPDEEINAVRTWIEQGAQDN